jgi:prevent-host-death family protein
VREVQVSDAKAHLPSLLDAVERGETIVITRHGKPIARIIPEVDRRRAELDRVIAEIEEFRKTMPRIPLEEILWARHDSIAGGHSRRALVTDNSTLKRSQFTNRKRHKLTLFGEILCRTLGFHRSRR